MWTECEVYSMADVHGSTKFFYHENIEKSFWEA